MGLSKLYRGYKYALKTRLDAACLLKNKRLIALGACIPVFLVLAQKLIIYLYFLVQFTIYLWRALYFSTLHYFGAEDGFAKNARYSKHCHKALKAICRQFYLSGTVSAAWFFEFALARRQILTDSSALPLIRVVLSRLKINENTGP